MFLMLGDNAFPRVLQHLETTSTLEALQHNSLAHHSMTNHKQKKKKENSHVKEKFSSRNPRVQKFHTRTKNPCQKKFPQPKPTLPKLVHNQKSCAQKGQFPTNKKKKTNAPPKISPQ